MTTITIERELLEQALSALLLPCDRWNGVQYRIVKDAAEALLNALAAPERKPMTSDEVFTAWTSTSKAASQISFTAGVRAAEAFHGIKGTP